VSPQTISCHGVTKAWYPVDAKKSENDHRKVYGKISSRYNTPVQPYLQFLHSAIKDYPENLTEF